MKRNYLFVTTMLLAASVTTTYCWPYLFQEGPSVQKLVQRGGISSYTRLSGVNIGWGQSNIKRITGNISKSSKSVTEFDLQGRLIKSYTQQSKKVFNKYIATYASTNLGSDLTISEQSHYPNSPKTFFSFCKCTELTTQKLSYKCTGNGFITINYDSQLKTIKWNHAIASGNTWVDHLGKPTKTEVRFKSNSIKQDHMLEIAYPNENKRIGKGYYANTNTLNWSDTIKGWFGIQPSEFKEMYSYLMSIENRNSRGHPTQVKIITHVHGKKTVSNSTLTYEYWSPLKLSLKSP